MYKASVSQIHLLLRCPRLFAYQLKGRRNPWKVGLKGSGDMPGKLFHDHVALPFHRSMASASYSPARQALDGLLAGPVEHIEPGILAVLREYFFIPLLMRQGVRLEGARAMQLARGVELWGKHLAKFLGSIARRSEGDAQSLPAKIFHNPEKTLQAVFHLESGTDLQVTGKYDALLFDPVGREAVVVEFKGRKAGCVEEDFLQVVLYCLLIREASGVIPRGVVFYLEEDEPAVSYSPEDIERAMHNIPHLFEHVAQTMEAVSSRRSIALPLPPDRGLCRVCMYDRTCDPYWGPREEDAPVGPSVEEIFSPVEDLSVPPAHPVPPVPPAAPLPVHPASGLPVTPGSASSPDGPEIPAGSPGGSPDLPETSDPDAVAEAEEGQKVLIATLKLLKLPVEPAGYIAGPRFIRYKIKPPFQRGVTVKKLMNQRENLQVELGLQVAPLIQPQAGFVSVDVPRKVMTPLTLGEVWRKGEVNRPCSRAAFPIGMSIDGSIVWANLAEPTMTSMLVGGTAGSGKSIFLRAAAVGLALNAKPDEVRLTLIDPKRVSFTDLAALPHLSCPVLMDSEPAAEALTRLVDEMERRYRLFEKARVPDITAYEQTGEVLPHQVVMIDEYADLMIYKDVKEHLELCIQRLGQKGRAAGMHMILATQRPDARIVTPIIKANLQLKVALKVTSAVNSAIILDQTGAECLIGHGDMLIGGSVPLQRLQGPLVSRTEIETGVRH